MSVNKRELST